MAVTPKIITILDYIKDTILAKPNGSGNYNYTFALVSRDYILPTDLRPDQIPAAFVVSEGMTSISPLATAQYYTTGRSRQDVTDGEVASIVCVVRPDDTTDLETTGLLSNAMDKAYSDVVIAWHTDRDLGGNVQGTSLIGKIKSYEYMDSDLGIMVVMFSLKYDFDPGSNVT